MRIIRFITFVMLFSGVNALGQNTTVSGEIQDNSENGIPGVKIEFVLNSDTTIVERAMSDLMGRFNLELNIIGPYTVRINSYSFAPYTNVIAIAEGANVIPTIRLKEDSKLLNDVVVEGLEMRVSENGDTVEFNADAFTTNPDATAEDLILKMPGVVYDGTTLKVNGEEVEVILVDGKPFFGDDPTTTLKNLPAEIVDNVQVYDKSSDQAEFTGFKDGNEQNAINIRTKPEKNIGNFGRTYAGYGTDDRYNIGGTYNYFNQDTRFSVLGMSNNINEQNFSFSDIMGMVQNSGASSGRLGPNSTADRFFSNAQDGNSLTNAFGLNYSDNWGKKFEFSGSYFFNYSDNSDSSEITRTYFSDEGLTYRENSISNNINMNHRINAKLQYNIDSSNQIIFTPSLTTQNFTSDVAMESSSIYEGISNFSITSLAESFSNSFALRFNADLLYRHRFRKEGRTFSINLNHGINDQVGDEDYYSSSLSDAFIEQVLEQTSNTTSDSRTYGVNVSYTEKIGSNGQLLLSYHPSWTLRSLNQLTYNEDEDGATLSSSLSNQYGSYIHSEQGGLQYQLNKGKLNFSIGADVQNIILENDQILPQEATTSTSFFSVLPSARLRYKISKTKSLNLNYRSETNIPSVSQLQDVLDLSNPLLISRGNVNLQPSYENSLTGRFAIRNPSKGRNFLVFLRGRYSSNYISSATSIITADTTIQGVFLNAGTQIEQPQNFDHFLSADIFSVYSITLRKLKSNLNLDAGYNHSFTPSKLEDETYYSQNQRIRLGTQLSSNFSEDLDLSIGYNGNLNFSTSSNINTKFIYFNHDISAKSNIILKKRIVMTLEYNLLAYTGLSDDFDQSYHLLNAGIGYKFLKNQSLELKLTSFDLLNQNTSLNRLVTEAYTEDSNTLVLQRYFMLNLTYTFKKFKSGGLENNFPSDGPPPGGRPPRR